MIRKNSRIISLAILIQLVFLCGGLAQNAVPTDEGAAADFKGKTVELKDNGEFSVLLTFSAGKKFAATTSGTKETDVHLFVYDSNKKEVGKDVSPGPKCEVTFTPERAGKYRLLVKNAGGTNTVTLEVKSAR
jgi:hypothetical protein